MHTPILPAEHLTRNNHSPQLKKKTKMNSQTAIKQQNRSLMRSMLQAPATVYSNFGNTEPKVKKQLKKQVGTERLEINSNDNFFNPQSTTISSSKGQMSGSYTNQVHSNALNKLKISSPPSLQIVNEKTKKTQLKAKATLKGLVN